MPLTPYIPRREPVRTVRGTAGLIGGRLPEQYAAQLPPEPPIDSLQNSRPSMAQISIFLHRVRHQVDSFLGRKVYSDPRPIAEVPSGRQLPWRERPNIRVPSSAAYGDHYEVG